LLQLTTLNLSRNQLSVLPNEIGMLEKLTTLELEDNKLSGLPRTIGLLSLLSTLNLRSNKIEYIPRILGAMPALSNLDISNNPLKDDLTEIIANTSQKNNNSSNSNGDRPVLPFTINLQQLRDRVTVKVRVNKMKLVLLGSSGSGKTRLIKTLQGLGINQSFLLVALTLDV